MILATGYLSLPALAQESLRQIKSNKTEIIDGKKFYIHSVKKGQTLYMISKAYEADIDGIIKENPDVRDGLKTGQKLRIPAPMTSEVPSGKAKSIPEEKKQTAKSTDEDLPPCGKDKASMRQVYNVTLMIPLYLGEVTDIDVNPDPEAPPQENRPLQFVQFYEGFRMALDSLEKTGVSLKVTVLDAERDTVKTLKMLQDPELKKSDLIIGMMYHRNFQMAADFAKKNNIPIVNPVSERDPIVENNKKVFKVRPSLKTQFTELISYLQSTFIDSNMVVISDNQRSNITTAKNIMSTLEDNKADVHLAEGYGEALSLLSAKKGNVIILVSDNKSFVLDVVTKLNEHRNEYGITLIGIPRWDRFDDIEADYLVNLRTHVLAPWFIDYDDTGVRKFVSKFQERYQTDPDPMAFQGFDVTWYFVTALWKYGKSFERCITDLQMKSLQTDFRFASSKDNGFVNQYWELYEYDNYRLKRILLK